MGICLECGLKTDGRALRQQEDRRLAAAMGLVARPGKPLASGVRRLPDEERAALERVYQPPVAREGEVTPYYEWRHS